MIFRSRPWAMIPMMSIKSSDLIALVSALIASIALFVSLYAASVTQRVATSGFQSAERVKSDTAVLLSALRGIMIKAALYSQQEPAKRDNEKDPNFVDIRAEKSVVQTFLNSSTALAYYSFVAKKSKSAREAAKQGEEWRIFFLQVGQLLSTGNTYQAGLLAGRIERMFDTISDKDFEEMSSELEDLVKATKTILQERQHDVLLQVFVDSPADDKKSAPFEEFIAYLRAHGIKDPDVDLFWSATSGDVKVAEDALSRGAKVNTTDSAIISRYKDQWTQFKAERTK